MESSAANSAKFVGWCRTEAGAWQAVTEPCETKGQCTQAVMLYGLQRTLGKVDYAVLPEGEQPKAMYPNRMMRSR